MPKDSRLIRDILTIWDPSCFLAIGVKQKSEERTNPPSSLYVQNLPSPKRSKKRRNPAQPPGQLQSVSARSKQLNRPGTRGAKKDVVKTVIKKNPARTKLKKVTKR
jgi:hypothetical protein